MKPETIQGNGERCYYCGHQCDGFAGDPGRWPVPMTQPDEPGRVKWHHIACVAVRLYLFDEMLRGHTVSRKNAKSAVNEVENRMSGVSLEIETEEETDEDRARWAVASIALSPTDLLPCPFCDETPVMEYRGGSCVDLECVCGMAGTSVQICDLMTIEERSDESSYDGATHRYADEYVQRAKEQLGEEWNTRGGG